MAKFIPVQGKFVVTLFLSITILLSGFLILPNSALAQEVENDFCDKGTLDRGDGTKDLLITAPCNVGAGEYKYRNVNIIANGVLNFMDEGPETNFWAKNILVENGGTLKAGESNAAGAFGANGGTLTIYLYGSKTDAGIACRSPQRTSGIPCGVDSTIWTSNTKDTINPTSCAKNTMPDGESECFYNYIDPTMPSADFFGSKVLAVSYGGTLNMYGSKGATYTDLPSNNSGTSWVRLDGSLSPPATSLKVDRDVDWQEGDHIVVTTTDYLPGHSEKLEITSRTSARQFSFKVLDPHTNKEITGGIQYPHNGKTFPVKTPVRLDQKITEAETRAAVGLLSRSIRVVSAGDTVGQMFDPNPNGRPTPGNFFGGHLMARQGVKSAEIQGVEFYQLGQGGVKGRYPVHMHLLRKSPKTFIKDNSIHDSMTRWITLHGTQGVTLARNVGYMSIGHGYYLEDGTEINNKLYSNLGVLARAAIKNKQNPREVPGILAYAKDKIGAETDVPYRSDYIQPTVFWIMNGWNDFEYNMAAGANACGTCYWWLPGQISGPSQKMKWESYAAQQSNPGRAGDTPLKTFKGNYCSSAMNSFNATADTSPCKGMGGPVEPFFDPVEVGNLSPTPMRGSDLEGYYPKVPGGHHPTFCKDGIDCSMLPATCSVNDLSNCAVTVIDSFTTAFHWTEVNFSAIWLRPQWYLVLNSVISDTIGAGLTFVTGGDYTLSNFLPGQWQLARKNIFIGQTQEGNGFASHAGPVNPATSTDLKCEDDKNGNVVTNRCFLRDEGLVIPLDPFNNQRLYNIYDGPNFEDSNAFLNIKKTVIDDCKVGQSNCQSSKWMYGRVAGMPKDAESATDQCIIPNAAIAWKQPNGFYYPPAFHSSNLYFDDVDIRHYVVEPLFEPISPTNPYAFKNDNEALKKAYCTFITTGPDNLGGTFSNFTAVDRQTILNDDDGSLSGLKSGRKSGGNDTIAVNEDQFFDAPVETIECASEKTAKMSPYDHVTTVVYPGCVAGKDCGGTCSRDGKPCADTSNCTPSIDPDPPNLCENTTWTDDCGASFCYGVPLYRQFLTGDEESNTVGQQIRMMGMSFFQRSNLTANNGIYYIDTTVSEQSQRDGLLLAPLQKPSLNVFKGGETYYVLQLFAKESTKQTYLYYVGDGFNPDTDVNAISSELKSSRPLDVKSVSWPTNWVRKWYKDDPTTKIVEVTVDYKEFSPKFAKAKMDRCQPQSFCTWEGDVQTGSCECKDKSDEECNKKLGDNKNTICSWAVRAVDCPDGGCLGFSFKLPTGFQADDLDPPTPTCYPSKNPDELNSVWNIDFDPVRDDLAGPGCNVNPLPPKNFCDLNEAAGTARNVIRGTEADDELIGTNGPDLIIGGGGNDVIRGRGGDDEIEGGPGDDTIDGNMGDDIIVGGDGNDFIMGGNGHDNIDAGEGDDFVKGGAGNDNVSGGDGSDVLIGQRGNDEIDGNSGDDMIEGNSGSDEIDGGPGDDSILGGAGGDNIDGGSGDDMIEGGGGPDTCTGGESGSVCENEQFNNLT